MSSLTLTFIAIQTLIIICRLAAVQFRASKIFFLLLFSLYHRRHILDHCILSTHIILSSSVNDFQQRQVNILLQRDDSWSHFLSYNFSLYFNKKKLHCVRRFNSQQRLEAQREIDNVSGNAVKCRKRAANDCMEYQTMHDA